VLGVFSESLTRPLAEVLGRLGTKHALVVHGEGNLDELTVTGRTLISEVVNGQVSDYSITPEELGLTRARLEDLIGGSTGAEAAALLRDVLGGEKGPRRDMVLLNSAAALKAAGDVDDFRAGIERAAQCLDSGRALQKFDELVAFSNRAA
jgi:anthranilate phosphoribosyltransferase